LQTEAEFFNRKEHKERKGLTFLTAEPMIGNNADGHGWGKRPRNPGAKDGDDALSRGLRRAW
jgi:hypothetical protein